MTCNNATANNINVNSGQIILNTDNNANGLEIKSVNAGTGFRIKGTTAGAYNSNGDNTITFGYGLGIITCV